MPRLFYSANLLSSYHIFIYLLVNTSIAPNFPPSQRSAPVRGRFFLLVPAFLLLVHILHFLQIMSNLLATSVSTRPLAPAWPRLGRASRPRSIVSRYPTLHLHGVDRTRQILVCSGALADSSGYNVDPVVSQDVQKDPFLSGLLRVYMAVKVYVKRVLGFLFRPFILLRENERWKRMMERRELKRAANKVRHRKISEPRHPFG